MSVCGIISILQPHTHQYYSLSPFSPASDVTVMVKLVGSSEITANTRALVTSLFPKRIA